MGFVCGKPGSGKSFSVKREITNTVLAHPEDQIIVFDPAGEYPTSSRRSADRTSRSPRFAHALEPVRPLGRRNMATTSQMAFKIDAFLALSSAMMAEGDEGLPEADKSIITRCVEAAYAKRGGDGTPTLSDSMKS